MSHVSMKALLETGVHFGHRSRKWNAKMKPYIFGERNGIHILDLQQTIVLIEDGYEVIRDTVANGRKVLFVGTKRQAQETIAREANRCGMPYVNYRWLGGMLTNWRTIRQRIEYLKELEGRRERGEFELLTKKEALTLERQIEKLNARLGGIRTMDSPPGALFVVDVVREDTAVREANILKVPVVAMVDSNGDPDSIDYIIPSNDDAIRAINLISKVMADAVIEGKAMRDEENVAEEDLVAAAGVYDYEFEESEQEDEQYLGQATLEKLKSNKLSFSDEEAQEAKEETNESEEEKKEDGGE